MSDFLTAVEFCTSKVAVAVGQKEGSKIKVLSHVVTPIEKGVARGDIRTPQVVVTALKCAIEQAEKECGQPISNVILCQKSQFTHTCEYTVTSTRDLPTKEITAKEIANLSRQALESPGDEGEHIFDAIAQRYNIDDNIGLAPDEVEGMTGYKVEAFFKLIIGSKTAYEQKRAVVERCIIRSSRLNIDHEIFSPAGTAMAVLSESEAENGAALVDIGAGTTDVVIVKDKIIRDIAVIPFGGNTITGDIKQVNCITGEMAEYIKTKYGNCIDEGIPDNKKLVIEGVGGNEDTNIPLVLLARVIEARMSEIFDAVLYTIDHAGYEGKLRGGLVITGGGCLMDGTRTLALAMSGCNARLSTIQGGITGDSPESCFDVTAASLMGALIEGFGHYDKIISARKSKSQPTNLLYAMDRAIVNDAESDYEEEIQEPQKRPQEPKKGGLFGRGSKKKEQKSEGSNFIDGVINFFNTDNNEA